VAKVRTVEEHADERAILMVVWCKGEKDAHKGGTDNEEILRRRYGPKAARSQAREVRAAERQIHERWNGHIAAKVRTVEEQAEERYSLTAVWC